MTGASAASSSGATQGWTDAADDRRIGGLWADLSDGRCRFVMVRDRDWGAIDAVLD